MAGDRQQDRVTHLWVGVSIVLFGVAFFAAFQGNDGAFTVLFSFASGFALGIVPVHMVCYTVRKRNV